MLYEIRFGFETWDSIAFSVYGDEGFARLLKSTNPGVSEPFKPGTLLTTPPFGALQTARIRPPLPTLSPDEVGIIVDGKRFRFWTEVSISRAIDRFDRIAFSTPVETIGDIKPLAFQPCTFVVGKKVLFTGTIVDVRPVLTNDKATVLVSGYALPGVLNDCQPTADTPLMFKDMTIKEVFSQIAEPFGVPVKFEGEPGDPLKYLAREPSMRALSFISEHARQRGLLVSNTPQGELLIWTAKATGNPPVALLRQGESPLVSVQADFDPQNYFSDITGLEPSRFVEGDNFSLANPKLVGHVRPHVFLSLDTEGVDTQAQVTAKIGRMFGNVVSYDVEVATWRDPQGELWEPNTTVYLQAPDALVPRRYRFLIRSVAFASSPSGRTATLKLVIPEGFSGEVPIKMPWEG